MVVNICGMSGIEVSLVYQRSIIGFYFFTVMLLYGTYHAVVDVKPRFVMFIKWPLLIYSVIIIIFAVIAFI